MELPAGSAQAAEGARSAAAAIVPGSSAPAGFGLAPGSLPPGALAKLALGGRAGGEGLGTLGNPSPGQTPAGGAASPAPGSSMEAPLTPPSNGRKAEHRCAHAASHVTRPPAHVWLVTCQCVYCDGPRHMQGDIQYSRHSDTTCLLSTCPNLLPYQHCALQHFHGSREAEGVSYGSSSSQPDDASDSGFANAITHRKDICFSS